MVLILGFQPSFDIARPLVVENCNYFGLWKVAVDCRSLVSFAVIGCFSSASDLKVLEVYSPCLCNSSSKGLSSDLNLYTRVYFSFDPCRRCHLRVYSSADCLLKIALANMDDQPLASRCFDSIVLLYTIEWLSSISNYNSQVSNWKCFRFYLCQK